jgi:peptide/nickel transport system permease protein
MLSHIIRRILLMIPNVIAMTFLLFATVSSFLGSPSASMLGQDASLDEIHALDKQYGFDRPVIVQYFDWIGHALHGDFGRSYTTQQSVADALLPTIPLTLELSLWAILLAVAMTVLLNSLPFARRLLQPVTTTLAVIGITIPNFMLGICLIYIFAVKLRWLPTTGWVPWSAGIENHLLHIILPVVTLSANYFGSFTLVYREEYKAAYRRLFIKVARAKGLSELRVSLVHALPNAILPVITYVGLSLGPLVGGAVVTEIVFSMPGVGRLFVGAIGAHDFPVMLAVGILVIFGVMLANLLSDIVYTSVNRQVSLG